MALRAVPDHPKFARLKSILHLPKGSALGWLESVWHFTGRFTPHGNIGKYSDQEIEAWVEWDGESGALIAALIASQWIDASEEHRLIVHDWHVHADNATKLSVNRSKKPFVNNSVSTVSPQCGLQGDKPSTVCGLPEPVPGPGAGPEPEPAKNISSPSETPPPATQLESSELQLSLEEQEEIRKEQDHQRAVTAGIDRLFAYYCRKMGRDPTRYTLTPARRKKAQSRIAEREKNSTLDAAISEARQCIDNLAASEHHRDGGYIDWTEQIFRSAEEFEKRLNWQKPVGGLNDRSTATSRSLAAAGEYLETLRDSEGPDAPEHSSPGRSLEGDVRRIC